MAAAALAVALGGAVGAVLRWLVSEAPPSEGFPWATFTVNVTGTLALAALAVVDAVRRRPVLAAGLGPGLLGGYTTLSACSEETRALLADGRTGVALAYIVGSVVAGVAVVAVVDRLRSIGGGTGGSP